MYTTHKKLALCVSVAFLFVLQSLPSVANVNTAMPDNYSEPGLNPFREAVSSNVSEAIDPFSGSLTLSHTDLVIPGNGGLDIKIERTYSSSSVYRNNAVGTNTAPYASLFQSRSPTGLGWTMHFGRVIHYPRDVEAATARLCDTTSTGPNIPLSNPVLELPNGTKQILFVNPDQSFSTYVTKSHWVADCLPGIDDPGIKVTSPDGIIYTMLNKVKYKESRFGEIVATNYYYTTKIEDRNGNSLNINYHPTYTSYSYPIISSIVSPADGRTVNFTYTNANDLANARLTSISSSSGATWRYDYETAAGESSTDGSATDYWLTGVRVDGTEFSSTSAPLWKYDYHDKTGINNPARAGHQVLSKITYPYGGTISYDYNYVNFMGGNQFIVETDKNFYALVVKSKQVEGYRAPPSQLGSSNPAVWNYDYAPSSTEDMTTVTFPGGKYIYRHYGFQSQHKTNGGANNELWKTGSLKSKETYDGTNLRVSEQYSWVPWVISNQQYIRLPYQDPRNALAQYDDKTNIPMLTGKTVNRAESTGGNSTYSTTYLDIDSVHFAPKTIIESGEADRVTQRTYYPRLKGQNIVGLVKDKWIAASGKPSLNLTPANRKILQTFDAKANLTEETRYGVRTGYTYLADGSLNTKTDANNKVSTYSSHYRGIPRSVALPEAVNISRTVNASGVITSETNARGKITAYTYDALNRVKTITPPKAGSTPASVNYANAYLNKSRTVVRGSYQQKITYDGFGETVCVLTQDTASGGATISQTNGYDNLGQRTYTSYPVSGSCATNTTPDGTSYTYDGIGRISRETHADNSFRRYDYLAGNSVRVTDEASNATTSEYQSFGDPFNTDERWLAKTTSPESIVTTIVRNILGQATSANQGGVTRTYSYTVSANNFLASENNPETGATSYLYDAVGNTTSRTIGGLATGYGFDGLNRLTSINYPGTTPDVTTSFDGNGNRTSVGNGVAQQTYVYDDNDNLTSEAMAIDSKSLTAIYTRNSLDMVTSLQYPSGLPVDYAPDALGRASKIGSFVSAIAYHANGQPSGFTYGNGHQVSISLNNRQRPVSFTSAGIFDLTYGYDAAGNIGSIADGVNPSRNRSFAYDGVNRLVSATGSWGNSAAISYSASGNILSKAVGGANLSYSYNAKNQLTNITGVKSRIFSYDVYGNVKSDHYYDFVYDDAGNMRTITSLYADSVTQNYDGNNLRVKRVQGSQPVKYYFYSAAGQLLGEYGTGSDAREYIYQGSKLIAERSVDATNVAPIASAGIDITAFVGDTVNLVGTASTDSDGNIVSYQWRQTSGTAVTFTSSNTSTATVSINTTGLPVGSYSFQLFVLDDDGARDVDTVTVIILDSSNADSDADGLNDLWEVQYFGGLGQTGTGDGDFDGITNLQEFQAGTDPSSAVPTGLVATGKAPTEIQLSWDNATSVTYNIYWSLTPGVTKTSGTKIANVSSPYLHTGLEFSKTYYYVITTNTTDGGESAESAEVSLELNDISWLIPILNLILD